MAPKRVHKVPQRANTFQANASSSSSSSSPGRAHTYQPDRNSSTSSSSSSSSSAAPRRDSGDPAARVGTSMPSAAGEHPKATRMVEERQDDVIIWVQARFRGALSRDLARRRKADAAIRLVQARFRGVLGREDAKERLRLRNGVWALGDHEAGRFVNRRRDELLAHKRWPSPT
ncbi:unnamed protein product, partial [Prorocentrum cordatum]